jgi:chitinase
MKREPLSLIGLVLALAFVALFSGVAEAQTCNPAWVTSKFYSVNELTSHTGRNYRTLQAHTSQVGWEPPNTPALFQDQGVCGGSATPTTPPRATATATTRPRATATATTRPRGTATATTRPRATATTPPRATATTPPRATATTPPTSGTENFEAAFWTQGNDPCTNRNTGGNGEEWFPRGACSGTGCWPAWSATQIYTGGAQVSRSCGGTNPTPTTPPRATATTPPRATATTPPRATATATSPQPTPCGTCGGALPARVITGYWHNFNNGSTTMKLNAIPSKYNLIAVAFADANPAAGTGAVTFNLDPATTYTGTAEFITHINQLNSANRPVIISVGGQNGTISVADSGSATRFANSVVALMNQYGFKGVDIDLENGLNAQFMTQALNSIRSQKPGAILTMAPQTIDMQNSANQYFMTAKNANVDLVNMQYYNSGCMLGCDQNACYGQGTLQFLTMLACIQVQGGLRGDQIGFGVPASTSAAGGGFYSTATVNAAMNCFNGNNAACGTPIPAFRAKVRGAMTWSINWDAVQGYSWVNGITVP